ncbi:hypothetical protein EVAR_5423_1 [Eumeta japonica]|uniref:Uncharacterized protein n=1 Tax=Eumeta variegata TaxID=151549 RepID=A0A4C1TBZ3_EUMVA|nr:hypothetical protein EVAR_5423_1 [Eumeta japonica]
MARIPLSLEMKAYRCYPSFGAGARNLCSLPAPAPGNADLYFGQSDVSLGNGFRISRETCLRLLARPPCRSICPWTDKGSGTFSRSKKS